MLTGVHSVAKLEPISTAFWPLLSISGLVTALFTAVFYEVPQYFVIVFLSIFLTTHTQKVTYTHKQHSWKSVIWYIICMCIFCALVIRAWKIQQSNSKNKNEFDENLKYTMRFLEKLAYRFAKFSYEMYTYICYICDYMRVYPILILIINDCIELFYKHIPYIINLEFIQTVFEMLPSWFTWTEEELDHHDPYDYKDFEHFKVC